MQPLLTHNRTQSDPSAAVYAPDRPRWYLYHGHLVFGVPATPEGPHALDRPGRAYVIARCVL